jgi:hypothetical protein
LTPRRCFWVVIQIFLVLISSNIRANSSDIEKPEPDYKWFVSIYGGLRTEENLAEIATLNADYSDENYLAVCALAREFYQYKQWLSFELEGQVGKHFGSDNDHWEFVGAVLGRWHPFPWDKYIDTSFAMGGGLSYNSDISETELKRDKHAQHLLGYLAFEFTFGLPQYSRWDLMLRIHHRSGAKGIIGQSVSNYLCVGLKFAF